MKWVTLFSQTGSEIYQVSERLGRFPDSIICNGQDFNKINANLIGNAPIHFTNSKPTVDEYLDLLPEDALVTMHGWLRIVPGEVCSKRTIYNGHPGDIVTYPELKGKDPQERAWHLQHEYGGCVIHEAVAEVDAGEIARAQQINIEGMSLDEVYKGLHDLSVTMWTEFLLDKFNEHN
jgi:methionyl-tRNA formyltransferase|tara:strand:- start:1 stop:531 length:531 start_codon:yes stop_codon:yes gene_type:complete